tara:strand:- start:5 stop:298 length:294 start_codon:yes stop_codon:yes gene_type:complete
MQEDNVSFTANNWPKDRWPNFAHRELACSETGECEMDPAFMDRLQLLRNHYGHALRITSIQYACHTSASTPRLILQIASPYRESGSIIALVASPNRR